jgi:hypothetical protein
VSLKLLKRLCANARKILDYLIILFQLVSFFALAVLLIESQTITRKTAKKNPLRYEELGNKLGGQVQELKTELQHERTIGEKKEAAWEVVKGRLESEGIT